MAFTPPIGSIVAFQSDPTKLVGTVSVVGSPTQIAGSILAVNMPSPSVVMMQQAGSILAVSGSFSSTPQSSIIATQIAGSVLAVNMPSPSVIALQLAGSVLAVSGSFSATPQGSITIMQSAGSVLGVRTDNASVIAVLSNSSVTALQGTNPWLINVPSPSTIAYQAAGSVMAVSGSFSANPQSSIIALQLAGSVMAVSATVNTGNSSVQLLAGVAAIGSVTALQGTNPWQVNVPTPSLIMYQAAGSILAVSGNFSSGNTSVQLLGGVATIGSVVALQGGVWATSMVGGPIQINSILGTYQEKSASVPSVIGWPMLFRSNTTTSVLTTPSATDPLPVQGSVTALQGTNPWIVNMPSPSIIIITPAGSVQGVRTDNASVIAVLSTSSVTALQGTNPWLIGNNSVLAFQGTSPWVMQSIIGTFGDNTAFTTNDKGLAVLGIRNDTVASIVNADKQYGQWAMDSAGRNLVIPFAAGEASIIANASVVNGSDSGSVVVFAAAGTGLRNYITDYQISNTGSVATLITFTEGGGSIIGRTIAPAGGGSNMPGMATPMRNQRANQPINMVTTTASSVVYVAAWGYKAP